MEQISRTPKQIGTIIQRRRRQLGLTQEQLGAKVRLRQATISQIESGEAGMQLRSLLAILGALDLELLIRPRSKVSPDQIEELF